MQTNPAKTITSSPHSHNTAFTLGRNLCGFILTCYYAQRFSTVFLVALLTFFARLDWQINEKNRLTLRNNYSDWNNPNSTDDNSSINLHEVYSNFKSRENSTLASLRTQFSPNLLNELKVQYQTVKRDYTRNDQLPAANISRAIVSAALPTATEGNPFSGTFDVRLQKTFKTFKNQGLTFSVDAFNFANLLNRDWGMNYNLVNQNLLTVIAPTQTDRTPGFDQTTRRYRCRVNENVGITNQNENPYQLQLGARYSF